MNLQTSQHEYSFPTWTDPQSNTLQAYGSQGEETHVFSNTAAYAPIVYLPHVLGFHLAKTLDLPVYWLVIFLRIIGLALYIAVTFWCIRAIPFGKWPFAVFASLPSTVSAVSTVTADTVTVVLSFMLITVFMRFICEKPTRSDWIVLGITTILLPVAKMAYVPLILLVLIIPLVNIDLRKRRQLGTLAAFFVCGVLGFVIWYSLIKNINTGAMWKVGIDPSAQIAFITSHPFTYCKTIIYSLITPDVLQVTSTGVQTLLMKSGWLGVIVLCSSMLILDKRELKTPWLLDKKRTILVFTVFLIIFLACAILTITALYLTFTTPESSDVSGVQERYFIPFALLALLPIYLLGTGLAHPLNRNLDGEMISGKQIIVGEDADNNSTSSSASHPVADIQPQCTWRYRMLVATTWAFAFCCIVAFIAGMMRHTF